jgi:hypothetical protein
MIPLLLPRNWRDDGPMFSNLIAALIPHMDTGLAKSTPAADIRIALGRLDARCVEDDTDQRRVAICQALRATSNAWQYIHERASTSRKGCFGKGKHSQKALEHDRTVEPGVYRLERDAAKTAYIHLRIFHDSFYFCYGYGFGDVDD